MEKHTFEPKFTLCALLLSLTLSACSSLPTSHGDNINSAEALYSRVTSTLAIGDINAAADHVVQLKTHFPDNSETRQSQLELAYAQYHSGAHQSAINTAQLFIDSYPEDQQLAYAHYLRALGSFSQTQASITNGQISPEQVVLVLQASSDHFTNLINNFPDSSYTADAQKRLTYLNQRRTLLRIDLARQLVAEGEFGQAVELTDSIITEHPDTESAAMATTIGKIAKFQIQRLNPYASVNADTGTATATTIDKMAAAPNTANIHGGRTETTANIIVTPMANNTSKQSIASKHGLMKEDWLLKQPSGHYSVQLISSKNKQALQRFATKNTLSEETALYSKKINGETWFSLVYGSFENARAARVAITTLPASIQKNKPWVVPIKGIHKSIHAGR